MLATAETRRAAAAPLVCDGVEADPEREPVVFPAEVFAVPELVELTTELVAVTDAV